MTSPSPDWNDFPEVTLYPERVLYRVHRTANDPVYFCSDGTGRFDITSVDGIGTCYVAPSPIGAYVETLGRLGTISESDVAERSLSELVLTRPLKLADMTNRQVLGSHRITGDLSVGTDYAESQAVASELYAVGFDGIYYTARHDPAFQERSVAVFGGPGDNKLFATGINDIPDDVIRQGAVEFNLWVLPNIY